MAWSQTDISNHIKCCNVLDEIKDEAFHFISQNHHVTERDVQVFILNKYKIYGLKTTHRPIVAFNASGANFHYAPKRDSRRLSENTLIMIDIWARFGKGRQPYADITWMGYTGKVSKEQTKVCDLVFTARDGCVRYLQKRLSEGRIPLGKELDAVTRKIIFDKGYAKYFPHSTGHSIGYNSPHGIYGALRRTNDAPLRTNIGYTIEPGIYLKNKFGVRSEIDFYITKDLKLVITTPMQKALVKII